jgi:hypothetical protein
MAMLAMNLETMLNQRRTSRLQRRDNEDLPLFPLSSGQMRLCCCIVRQYCRLHRQYALGVRGPTISTHQCSKILECIETMPGLHLKAIDYVIAAIL